MLGERVHLPVVAELGAAGRGERAHERAAADAARSRSRARRAAGTRARRSGGSRPRSSASSRVGGSFSPGSSSPDSIAAAKRSTTCWVSEVAPSRSSSDKSILYDLESTLVGRTLSLHGHTRNGCTTQEVTHMSNVTVRRSTSGDESALARLAALDSASPPRGPALIAEADTRMLAALPLGSGRPIADPFEPTRGARAAARAAPQRRSAPPASSRPVAARLPLAPARPPLTRLEASARYPGAPRRGSNQQPPPANGAGPLPQGRRRFAIPARRR